MGGEGHVWGGRYVSILEIEIIEKVTFEQSPEGGRELEIWPELFWQKEPPAKCPNSGACPGSLGLRQDAGMAGME